MSPSPVNTWYPQWPVACKSCGEDSSFTPASAALGNGYEMWQCGSCGGITAGPELLDQRGGIAAWARNPDYVSPIE